MSTHSTGEQAPTSPRRRGAIDLNRSPPDRSQVVHQAVQQPHFIQQPIDVEAFDDDVILSTQSDFLEAKNNSRRNRGRTIVDVDLLEITPDNHRRDSLSETIPNSDPYIKSEGGASSQQEKDTKSAEPPKEPVFTCPICMEPFVEEVSTKCGHIFCRSCIKAAIKAQGKCPTCRVKVTAKGLIRVFLPTATSP